MATGGIGCGETDLLGMAMEASSDEGELTEEEGEEERKEGEEMEAEAVQEEEEEEGGDETQGEAGGEEGAAAVAKEGAEAPPCGALGSLTLPYPTLPEPYPNPTRTLP